jgi:hypothetical protein
MRERIEGGNMKTYKLKRTGNALLEFKGEILSTGASRAEKDDTRWHEATIYRTKGGCLVMQVVFHTTADKEIDHYFAKVTSPDRIADDFSQYDPMTNVLGVPPGEESGQEQRRLETELRARCGELIRVVLQQARIVERIE